MVLLTIFFHSVWLGWKLTPSHWSDIRIRAAQLRNKEAWLSKEVKEWSKNDLPVGRTRDLDLVSREERRKGCWIRDWGRIQVLTYVYPGRSGRGTRDGVHDNCEPSGKRPIHSHHPGALRNWSLPNSFYLRNSHRLTTAICLHAFSKTKLRNLDYLWNYFHQLKD